MVIVWILAGCLAVAIVAAAALWIALWRTRERAAQTDTIIAAARTEIQAAVRDETTAHVEEIRRTFARERADTMSQLAAEERRLGEERRSIVADRERRVSEGLSDTLADVERRLDERLQGVADDLDRAERHLEAQLARLTQRQQQAIADVEARIEREAAELDDERRAAARGRAAPRGARASGSLRRDRGARRARGTHDRTPPLGGGDHRALRIREAAIAEGIEQAETDARARLELTLIEFERRQTERLERVSERESSAMPRWRRRRSTSGCARFGRMRRRGSPASSTERSRR